jgi:hypothetical protein
MPVAATRVNSDCEIRELRIVLDVVNISGQHHTTNNLVDQVPCRIEPGTAFFDTSLGTKLILEISNRNHRGKVSLHNPVNKLVNEREEVRMNPLASVIDKLVRADTEKHERKAGGGLKVE